MKSIYEKENKRLTFEIHEEIDEYVVQNMRRRIDNEIERYMPKEVIFDFNKVSFMDSAGIGLIIGRYKLASMLGGKVEVTNLTVQVRKIFEMSGILKIIPEVKCTEKKRSEVKCTEKSDLRCAMHGKKAISGVQEVKYE